MAYALMAYCHAIIGEIVSKSPTETRVAHVHVHVSSCASEIEEAESQLIGISAHAIQRSLERVDLLGELVVPRAPVVHVSLVATGPREMRAPEGHYWPPCRGDRDCTHVGYTCSALEFLQHRGDRVAGADRCRLSPQSLRDLQGRRVNVYSFVATRDRHAAVIIDVNSATERRAGRAHAPVEFPRFPGRRSAAGQALFPVVRHRPDRADLIKRSRCLVRWYVNK